MNSNFNAPFTFNNKQALAKLISDMESKKPASAVKIESERRPLAADFVPGPYDVICARGAAAKKHPGNIRFRQIIQQFKPIYSKAETKVDKSLLVSEIVDSVRGMSPNGGFVKKFGNQWMEVGDSVAREKIGQCLRDQLHSKYKSSTQAKKVRRKEMQATEEESDHEEQEVIAPKVVPVATTLSPPPLKQAESFGPLPLPPTLTKQRSSILLFKDFQLESPRSSICFLKDLDLSGVLFSL